VVLALLAAIVVFCVVQDRITAAAVGQYVALQRAAISGAGPRVTIDEVMRPAVQRSLRDGAIWALATLAAGLMGAVIWIYLKGRTST
jgi:hypothetical protein